MKKNLAKYDNIVVVPFGMWNEKTEIGFERRGDSGSVLNEDALEKVPVDTIDNVCYEDRVTFIKMDIEGSELNALQGAINVIRRDRPRLAICIYHSFEDLYQIPLWIKDTVPEYKLYMRHHNDDATETVIYATI